MPEEITNWIEDTLGIGADIQQNMLETIAVILVLLLLRLIVRWLVRRRTDDAEAIYRWRKATEYLTLTLGIVALLLIWLPNAGSFATYLGLVSAGLAIALQDPITDFVGWIFIVWRHPFSLGDRIQIGTHAGDVVDIRYFQFSIMEIGNWVDADQSTGRVLHIPNKWIFTQVLANYSKGLTLIWNELVVDVTFESDWALAKSVLAGIAAEHGAQYSQGARQKLAKAADRYFINYENLTPIIYTRVVENGVRLTVRYLAEPRQRRGTENALWEAILRAFEQEPKIEFAYPTVRRYIHPDEAKPDLRPDVLYAQARGDDQ